MEKLITFFVDNFPSFSQLLMEGPIALLWAYFCLYISGYLKKYRGIKTGYSRKIFHFLIFATVAIIHWIWGLPTVCLFGGMTSLVIFYAIMQGSGNLLYEAIAREKDAPHRTYYIVIPYFATLIGGVATNIFFAETAVIGYLVTGIGDAIAEPVGTRFGKHVYTMPSFGKVPSTRSMEGSAAVCLASCFSIIIVAWTNPELNLSAQNSWRVPVLSLICMITEAISPHGWDNIPMQIIPAWLAELAF